MEKKNSPFFSFHVLEKKSLSQHFIEISTFSPLFNLINSAYFHQFQLFWSQNVQLFQEILAFTFGVSNFYTF